MARGEAGLAGAVAVVYTLASFLNLPSGDGLIPEPARSWIMAGGLVALVLYGAVRVVLYLFGNDPPASRG
jgi:hypothetical protein